MRSVYISMEAVGCYVPLSVASLLTGLVQSLGTSWGLFRHHWILAKLMINVFATIVLLMYMQTLDYLAGVAADTAFSGAGLGGVTSRRRLRVAHHRPQLGPQPRSPAPREQLPGGDGSPLALPTPHDLEEGHRVGQHVAVDGT